MLHDPNTARVGKLVIAQALLTILLSLIGFFWSWQVARDAFIGGLAVTAGSGLFALWLLKRTGAVAPDALLGQLYLGELLKLAVIVIVFGVAIKKVGDLHMAVMLTVFFIVQVVPLLLTNKIAR